MGVFITQTCFDDVDMRTQVKSDNSQSILPVAQPGSGASINAPSNTNFGDVSIINNNTVNQFGNFGNKPYRVKIIDLSAAGNMMIDLPGTVIIFNDAKDGTTNQPATGAIMTCQLENQSADRFTIRPGWVMTGNKVSKIYLSWPAQLGVVCEMMIIEDRPLDRVDVLV